MTLSILCFEETAKPKSVSETSAFGFGHVSISTTHSQISLCGVGNNYKVQQKACITTACLRIALTRRGSSLGARIQSVLTI